MSTDLTDALRELGAEPPQWQTVGEERIPVHKFGKDHWSTFAYVETRTVDYFGKLDHDHMRCDPQRHPSLYVAKRRPPTIRPVGTYPTRLKRALPVGQVTGTPEPVTVGQVTGTPEPVTVDGHDDYDCLDDLRAAGLLDVTMPRSDGRRFRDAHGRVIPDVNPLLVTGLTEGDLCVHAQWRLTARGQAVASELRAHKAAGGQFATFDPSAAAMATPQEEQ